MYIQVILNLNQEEKLQGNKFIDNLKNLNSVNQVVENVGNRSISPTVSTILYIKM